MEQGGAAILGWAIWGWAIWGWAVLDLAEVGNQIAGLEAHVELKLGDIT